jgi:hypothetical protein
LADWVPTKWDQIPAVAHLIDRDEQVLVLDLIFIGNASPGDRAALDHFAEMLEAVGERPVGLEAAQLNGIAQLAGKEWNPQSVNLMTSGMRSQVVALVAAALEPAKLYSEITTRDGLKSFEYLYTKPVKFEDAPEPFCLDLYKYFDLDRLAILAEPVKVSQSDFVESKPKGEKQNP